MKHTNTTGVQSRRSPAVIAVAVLSALLGFAAVYGTLGRPDNTGGAAANGADATAPASKGGAAKHKGSIVAFVHRQSPEQLADVSFTDGDGATKSLKDFRGKTVLLNLWATWCAPCRAEMPSLDRLQKDLGSEKFQVVALAVDRGGVEAARKFLDSIKVSNLGVYVDKTAKSGSALKALGLPTTILIDAEGRELGRLPGPAEWDSPEAKALIEAALR